MEGIGLEVGRPEERPRATERGGDLDWEEATGLEGGSAGKESQEVMVTHR